MQAAHLHSQWDEGRRQMTTRKTISPYSMVFSPPVVQEDNFSIPGYLKPQVTILFDILE